MNEARQIASPGAHSLRWRALAISVAIALVAGAFAAAPATIPPAAASSGGPMVLDGTDAGLHGSYNTSTGELQSTWRYVGAAYPVIYDAVKRSHDEWVAVIGAAESTTTSNNCGGMVNYVSDATGIDVEYYRGVDAIDDLFAGLADGSLRPAFLHIVEATHLWWCQNGLTLDEDNRLTVHASAIAEFVNAGGGLFAQDHNYGWLSALLPGAGKAVASGSNPIFTEAGQAAFPTLTNADIAAMYHGQFTGDFSPLEVLAKENGNIIIGGLEVQLPSNITVSGGGAAQIDTSADLTVTVKDGEGDPIADGEVSMLVLSGPNKDATDSKQTAGDGTATFTLTSGATGTDSVRFTHDGQSATADVNWVINPPSAPQNLSATPGDGEISLAWGTPADLGGGSLSHYEVEYRPAGESSWTAHGTVEATSATITGLDNDTAYEVRVAAVNEGGTGAYATVEEITPGAPSGGSAEVDPSDPAGTSVETGSGTLIFTFDNARKSDDAEAAMVTVEPVADGGADRTRGLTMLGQRFAVTATNLEFDAVEVCIPIDGGAFSAAERPVDRLRVLHTAEDGSERDVTAKVDLEGDPAIVCGTTDNFADFQVAVYAAERLRGEDRYATAAAVATNLYPEGAATVYLASGERHPDGLVAGVAASMEDAPLLLTRETSLPDATGTALDELNPDTVVVIGGSAAVAEGVLDEVETHTGATATRISGPDRYATAAALAEARFPDGAPTVYLASGHTYPDALTGGGAALADGGALILTKPGVLPQETHAAIETLAPDEIVVLGGTSAVSDAVFDEVGVTAPAIRVGGATRYETAAFVAARFTETGGNVVAATGLRFADALVGSTLAGRLGAPILLIDGDTVPVAVDAELARLEPAHLAVVGGHAAVGPQAELKLTRTLPEFIPGRL